MDRVLIAGIVGLLAAMLTTLVCGVPVPQIHDEFSYLLAGDTYAHGRLTNPPHPLWPWFETFHTLQQPTYMSKYPPGQGLFLALGQLVGLPIAGVWLSAALACAALTWMLLGWLPERWALAGGALAALHPAMLGWSHSYWGAAVPIIGGALAVGAVKRANGLLLGLGIVILANTRPWEGFVLVAVLAPLIIRMVPWRQIAVAAIVVVLGGAFMLYDNQRVTHDPLLLPYALYQRQYESTPPLVWMKTHPVALRQQQMQFVTDGFERAFYEQRHSLGRFLRSLPGTIATHANGAFQFIPDPMIVRVMSPTGTIALTIVAFLLELPLLVPLLFVPRAMRPYAVVLAVAAAIALLPAVFPLPHYAAPFIPLLVLLWLAGLHEIASRRAIAAVAAFWMFGVAMFFVENRPWRFRWDEVGYRLAVERDLKWRPGRHVVIVRYQTSHNPHFEWVENGADIDGQKIVWAHDMPDNAPLLRYFAGRSAWRLTVGDRPPVLESAGRLPAPAHRPPATPGAAAVR
jgi:hypothetical protein